MKLGWNLLQAKIYETLVADAGVSALVGTRVYDTLQDPPFAFPFVILGDWDSSASLDKPGAQEATITIEARSTQRGNKEVNSVLEAIVAALVKVRLTPGGGIGRTVGRYVDGASVVEQWDSGEIVQSGFVRLGYLVYEVNE